MVKNNLNVIGHITSTTNLLFQIIVVHCVIRLHITNIYKEGDINISPSVIDNIPVSSNNHHIVVGDVNSHNIGSTNRKILEDYVKEHGLVVLNDGSPTLLNTHNLTP